MRSLLAIVVLSFIASPAFALIEMGPKSATKIKDTTLVESVTSADAAGKPVVLKRFTQGLRQKKVALFWVNVYVAQMFSAQKPDFASIDKLRASIAKGIPAVISMTFLRDIGVSKIIDGFKEGLKENGVKTDAAPYSKFLDAVKASGDVKDGQTYHVAFSGDDKKVTISFQTNGKEYFNMADADAATMDSLLKIWVGKPVDSGLEKMQEQLLKP